MNPKTLLNPISIHSCISAVLASILIFCPQAARADLGYPEVFGSHAAAAEASPTAEIDQHTGNAAYSYPVVLPPGRDGVTPNLTLVYSSAGGNSWVGRGFSLETSTIQRDSRDGVPRYDQTDRYTVDGVPLIPREA